MFYKSDDQLPRVVEHFERDTNHTIDKLSV